MTLRERLHDLADAVPPVVVPPDLFDRSRRRIRLRWLAAGAGVLLVLAAGTVVVPHLAPDPVAGGATAGLPDRVVVPPWWTDTVDHSPNGPVSVAFNGNSPQADHEDAKLQFWRDGYTIEPTVVVGLYRDTYRIVRGTYWVGTMLSPDGRYLVWEANGIGGGGAEALDLTTGATRSLSGIVDGSPLGWSADGRWLVFQHHGTAIVVSWPSGRVDGRVPFDTRPEARLAGYHHGVTFALSPNGSLLAIGIDDRVRVYRRDGTPLWAVPSVDLIAGRVAWLDDERLTLVRRDTQAVTLVYADGSTGAPTQGPAIPPLPPATRIDVVAWRADTAYAIVSDRDGAVALVRLAPGAAPQTLLTAPHGTMNMMVATDYLDTRRRAGSPQAGVNVPELLVRAACPGFVLLAAICFVTWIWRDRRRA